jgi:hypothetical protein
MVQLTHDQGQPFPCDDFRIWRKRRERRDFARPNEEYISQGKQHRPADEGSGEKPRLVGILDADEDHRLFGGDQLQDGVVVREWKVSDEQGTDSHREDEAQIWRLATMRRIISDSPMERRP